MAPGRGDLQRPLHIFLSHHVPQIRQGFLLGPGHPAPGRGKRRLSPEMGHKRGRLLYAVDRKAAGEGGFGGIFRWHEQLADAGVPGGQGHGQYAPDAPQGTR